MTRDEALATLLARPIAHRGLHDSALGRIENSFEAAEAAIVGGYAIECDVQATRDGEAVVFHDDTLERLTEATGAVADRTAAELSSLGLRGGGAIPTLEAFLARIGGRTPLVVEIKSRFDGDLRLTDRVAALVSGHDTVAIESFDPAVMARCRALGLGQPLGLVGPAETKATPDLDLAPHDFLSWAIADLAALRATHTAIPLSTWTIRSRAQHDVAKSLGAQIVFERFVPA